MKLIKEIESRIDYRGWLTKWAIFWCDNCNKEVEKPFGNGLKQKFCGCLGDGSYKHGGTGTRLYNIWWGIQKRCNNSNHKYYKDYGGRGITICPEWADKENGFINFRNWALNNEYADNLEIDRRNTNGNYEPNNCRWITHQENTQNRRNNKLTQEKVNEIIELDNTGNYTQKQLAEIYNVSKGYIFEIIHNKKWRIKNAN